ncbi:SRPBCC family protein [Leifsonia sp. AG29]|uniref:SRPBCC family protein n=1 Tax=Leifsonia sp. AG29 TaxID=2598860 RepID=UPI003FA35979
MRDGTPWVPGTGDTESRRRTPVSQSVEPLMTGSTSVPGADGRVRPSIADMPDIEVERHLSAEPDAVWRELTQPESLSAWFWPASFDTDAVIEPRIGGRTRIASRANGMSVTGEVVSAEPGRQLSTTWQWGGEDEVTSVSFTLAAADRGGTTLHVQHLGFPDRATADDHVLGWNDCLDRLAARLGRVRPPSARRVRLRRSRGPCQIRRRRVRVC